MSRLLTPKLGYRLSREGQLWILFAMLLGLIGWYKRINVTLLVAYTMAGLLFVNAILAKLHARRIRPSRLPLAPVFADESAHALITLANRHALAGSVTIVDSLAGRGVRWFLHGGPADPREVLHQPRQKLARGRYPCEPLIVVSGFPFGLVEYGLQMKADDREQIVLPARGAIDVPGLRRWLSHSGGETGQRRQPMRRVTSDQADVRGVRPFRPGDSVRWIHWRTTAHRGEPMVREYDEPPSPALLIVIDPWQPSNPNDEDRNRFERVLELASSIAFALGQEDASRVTLIVPGFELPESRRSSTPQSLLAVLAPLADLQASPDVKLPMVSSQLARNTARLIVSMRPNSPLADALARQTGRPFLTLDATHPPPWFQSPCETQLPAIEFSPRALRATDSQAASGTDPILRSDLN